MLKICRILCWVLHFCYCFWCQLAPMVPNVHPNKSFAWWDLSCQGSRSHKNRRNHHSFWWGQPPSTISMMSYMSYVNICNMYIHPSFRVPSHRSIYHHLAICRPISIAVGQISSGEIVPHPHFGVPIIWSHILMVTNWQYFPSKHHQKLGSLQIMKHSLFHDVPLENHQESIRIWGFGVFPMYFPCVSTSWLWRTSASFLAASLVFSADCARSAACRAWMSGFVEFWGEKSSKIGKDHQKSSKNINDIIKDHQRSWH